MGAQNTVSILVTGASGLVGKAFIEHLLQQGRPVTGVYRSHPKTPRQGLAVQQCEDLLTHQNSLSFKDIHTVVHCAAHVHQMGENGANNEQRYFDINCEASVELATRAAANGVTRFVFISSVKVNGEKTTAGQPFTENNTPAPEDPYGKSKRLAEQKLLALAKQSPMDVVIIRPPLVYGPGVKANFKSLINFVGKSPVLPFICLKNKRSLVGIANLVSFIDLCTTAKHASNEVFLVSDGEDLTLHQLCQTIATSLSLKRPPLPVPQALFAFIGKLTRKQDVIDRLSNDLCVDITKAQDKLGWEPPHSVLEQIKQATKDRLK